MNKFLAMTCVKMAHLFLNLGKMFTHGAGDVPFLGDAICDNCGDEWTVFHQHASEVHPQIEMCCPSCGNEKARLK